MNLLNFAHNNIHASEISLIAQSICHYRESFDSELSSVDHLRLVLADNPLGLEGAVAIGKLLSNSDHYLGLVDFSWCELTLNRDLPTLPINNSLALDGNVLHIEAVERQLCHLPSNTSVAALILTGNNFTGEGIHILASFMCLCTNLDLLCTCRCGITSDDLLNRLFPKLESLKCSHSSYCSGLRTWDLCDNAIDDEFVKVLRRKTLNQADFLFSSMDFQCFKLDDNPTTDEVVLRMLSVLVRY